MSTTLPIFWSSEPSTVVPFSFEASHSSLAWELTICELPGWAVAAAGDVTVLNGAGAWASAVDIVNPLTAVRTTSVLVMFVLLVESQSEALSGTMAYPIQRARRGSSSATGHAAAD